MYHGVDNAITTVLLSSYNKRTTQQQQTHPHTRPRTKTDVARSESTWKQRQTVSANPHLREEGRRMSETKISVTHANRLKFKKFTNNVHSPCKWIQNVLNENCSQLGSRLAKIGTKWGSGERYFGRIALIVSSSQKIAVYPLLTSDPSQWSRKCKTSFVSSTRRRFERSRFWEAFLDPELGPSEQAVL